VVGSYEVQQYLARLAREADLVIIDSSPVLGVSDPIVLASHVDAVVLVANARGTRGDEAAAAVAALHNAGGWVMGVVLNDIPRRRAPIERARALRATSAPKRVLTTMGPRVSPARTWLSTTWATAKSTCGQAVATARHLAVSGWSAASTSARPAARIRPWALVKRMARRWPKGASS
jgi:hypothetical protein